MKNKFFLTLTTLLIILLFISTTTATTLLTSQNGTYTYKNYSQSSNILTTGQSLREKPCYWIMTKKVELPIPVDCTGIGKAICENNGNIYIAGEYSNQKTKPCYWKNNKKIDLSIPAGCKYATTYKIYIEKGNLIITGMYINSDNKFCVCYWFNQRRTDFITEIVDEYARCDCVYYNNGELYTIGINASIDFLNCEINQKAFPYYLKGKNIILLPLPEESKYGFVSSICFFNDHIYASGCYDVREEGAPRGLFYTCYWKDEKFTKDFHSDYGSVTMAITDSCIYNGNLYTSIVDCGQSSLSNGFQIYEIPLDSAIYLVINSICVFNYVIYSAGMYDETIPSYWEGAHRKSLTDGLEVNDIYVY